MAGSAWADWVPRPDLDATAPNWALGRDFEPPATRMRWLSRPFDPQFALSQLGLDGVELIDRLARLGDLWILEAPAANAAAVWARWSGLGELQVDESGEPALLASTRLIGARDRVWDSYGLRGDFSSSIAILDSGCDTAHDDLGDPDTDNEDAPPASGDARDWADARLGFPGDPAIRVVGWHDVTDDLPLAVGPWDYHYHGTALASAAFGSGKIDERYQGVAPRGRIVVVKTWNYEDRWERWGSDLLLGMEWVIENAEVYRIRAVLVGVVYDTDPGFGPMIEALNARGIAVIAPSGNARSEMGYPARLPGVIAVGATDSRGRVTAYSAPGPGTMPSDTLDLVAPGGSLLESDAPLVVADNEPNDTYRGRVGTSLAAAHVAGAISLIHQAMAESGRPWRRDAAQVQWLTDLLRLTTAEIAEAEPGAPVTPLRNRRGADRAEGFGLLQVPAAVDAVRRILWPGSSASFALDAPDLGAASWAARVPTRSSRPFEVELQVPATGDYDLSVYAEYEDGFRSVGASMRAGFGGFERVRLEHPRTDWTLIVVRRVAGNGLAELRTSTELRGAQNWPNAVRSVQRSTPVVADLDGDGRNEVIVLNNAENDPTVHNFHVWRDDGETFSFFPLTVFSSGRPGELTTPAVGPLDGEIAIVAGSAFGEVYAVRPNSELRWARTVSTGATTLPLLSKEGGADRVIVGVNAGLAVLAGDGTLLRVLPTAAPIVQPLAAGDLDGDGEHEWVAVDEAGSIHVKRADGSALPGWPLALGGVLTAPLLRGDGDGGPVREILVVQRSEVGAMFLFRLGPDASQLSGSPVELATAGDAVLEHSAAVLVPMVRGAAHSVVVAAISASFTAPLRVWSHIVRPEGNVDAQFVQFVQADMLNSLLFLNDLRLAEPRVADLYGIGEREVLVAVRAGWSVFRPVEFIRTGGFAGFVTFREGAEPTLLPLTADRDQIASTGLVAPTFGDLDGDGRPEWIVGRDREIHVIGSRLPEELSTSWPLERGSLARTGCVGCEFLEPVAAAPILGTILSLRAIPNPFNPRVELRAELPGPGAVRWELFDLRGRRVRAWESVATAAGPHSSVLEARDETGRLLASGSYLARVSWGDEQQVTRVTLVR